jgi:MFS family permease
MLVSNVGTWMQRVAQDWLVLVVSGGSASALGITTGLQFLPILLFSAYAGAIADRVPKRTLLMCTQIGLAVPATVLGVLAVTGAAQAWHVYVLAFVFGTAWAIEAPGRQAIVSELVTSEDVPNAVGLNSASFNAGRIIGPAVAGLTIAAFGSGVEGTGVVILLNAASYLAVLAALARIGRRPLPDDGSNGPRGRVRDGVAYLRGRPDLLLVLGIMAFTGTFGLNFQMTSALMATEVFGKGATEYGLLGTTMACGSIIGALLAARRSSSSAQLVLGAAIVFGTIEIVFGLMPSYLTFALLTPLIGITAMTAITSANAYVQLTTPDRLRGRVMALYLTVFMGGTPLGAPLIGWLAEVLGARWSLIGGGLGTIAGSVLVATLLAARFGREALYNPGSEPPLPAPGDPGRTAAADPHRGGQPAGPWVAETEPSEAQEPSAPSTPTAPNVVNGSTGSGRPSSTPPVSTGPSAPVAVATPTRSRGGGASSSATST